MSLRDHLLGTPEMLDASGLARGVRHGSEGFAIRCIRALGERRGAGDLDAPLRDPRTGVRRAAHAAVGHRGGPPAPHPAESTEESRIAAAVAEVRSGGDPARAAAALARFERRTLETAGGARTPSAVTGGGLEARFWQCLGAVSPQPGGEPPHGIPGVEPRADLLARRRAALSADARRHVQDLASLRHPDDFAVVTALVHSSGRRGEHAVLAALGLLGDPRALPILHAALRETDVDPGRGFAHRRVSAQALGRLGIAAAVPWLLRALEDEALDYEGRPGAGLGIQFPVRTTLLWALGEIGDPAAIPTLVGYLGNTHGSALGGFYLPAMDALVKFGPAAAPPLRTVAARGAEIPAANAVGVLGAIGEDVSRWATDPRLPVRDVARRIRERT